NRLLHSASLYLRKHAENPIDWWPWCPEALEKAAAEDKPIFLSIGYSSCHWCTVMEGEAFSDPAVADYLNAHFVPIKVDREERPDVDSIYMQFLQMMVGQGGWPLNVFLSPKERIPFYGGTYFPLEPRYGRPGFLQVLENLHRYYQSDRGRLIEIQQEMLQGLQHAIDLGTPQEWDTQLLGQGLEICTRIIAPRFNGNSFPMMPYALSVLRRSRWADEGGENARKACQQRGFDLVLGGIYDHVGGGFHRYTVDATWTVPHFEKMLYDNGQILEFLACLWVSGTQEAAILRAIEGTVAWLKREMTDAAGYFYAAQDADSFATATDREPEEGAFYVWRYAELETVLTEAELTALTQEFTVTETGNFEGQNVLQRRHRGDLSEAAQTALAKLFQLRYGTADHEGMIFPPARSNAEAKTEPWPGRIPAVTDTKMIVAWNGLMISGLAIAARVLQRPDFYALAEQAATFILQHQWQPVSGQEGQGEQPDLRLHRLHYDGQAAVLAQSEDYAFWIKALLDLHQAQLCIPGVNTDQDWLQAARSAQAEFDRWLGDPAGGYYNAAIDASEDLVVRERNYFDNATPSGNGVGTENLVRLALVTEDLQYLDQAQQTLKTFSAAMERSPQACPSLLAALDTYEHAALLKLSPTAIVSWPQTYGPTVSLKTGTDLPEGTVGMVCAGLSCQAPAESLAVLQDQLDSVTTPPL
ncbi:MAG: thioredoxin domain-containing protein, partial [Prochlorotrichaceae cyanobacterium]